jgi:ribonuclease BN (tRNA processing enzyme)
MLANAYRDHHMLASCLLAALLFFLIPVRATAQQGSCGADNLALQILGSGGPSTTSKRASTSYLVWHKDRAVVMVDVGGGAFLRFGESGARLEDLSLLAISHLHPDHVSDLPALLWLSERARQKSLKLTGPSSGGPFPDIATFLRRMFDPANGAFAVLAGTLGEKGNGVRLDATVVDVKSPTASNVFQDGDLDVTAIGVPHGDAPSAAYRVRVGEHSIVFSGDQTGRNPNFISFAMGADVLVMHFALSMQASEAQARIHAPPAVVGQVARDAKVKRLVLSHFYLGYPQDPGREGTSLFNLDQNVAEVKKYYSGPLTLANDLQCIPIR